MDRVINKSADMRTKIFLSTGLVLPVLSAAFTSPDLARRGSQTPLYASRNDTPSISRRNLLGTMGILTTSLLLHPIVAHAIPMVSTDEFDILLRDSSLSVQVVEFSGPRSETVIVKLVDGTTFGIKDIVESPTDPRSPLKIAAACRESGVKTRFVDLENMLASSPRKKKMYTNQRVQEAQEKEREKQERIRRDEEERIEQLRKLEMEEGAK